MYLLKQKEKISMHFIKVHAHTLLFSHYRKKNVLEKNYIFSLNRNVSLK